MNALRDSQVKPTNARQSDRRLDDPAAYRFHAIEEFANQIVDRLRNELTTLGFDASEVALKSPGDAVYRLEKDPAIGKYSLVGDWIDDQGRKFGSLLFHADGSFFVEQDVVRPHPRHTPWFVEAVNAWGRDTNIKVEARLLPLPD